MSKLQQKILALVTGYLADITIIAWIYFKATNFARYTRLSNEMIDSPDFQFQLYTVMLKSLTFMLLLFLAAQSVTYILAAKNFRSAYLYLKFFAVFGFTLSLYVTITSSLFGFLPLCIYLFGYYIFARNFTELTAKLQNLPQSPTPQ